jgi:hypothetical protein
VRCLARLPACVQADRTRANQASRVMHSLCRPLQWR